VDWNGYVHWIGHARIADYQGFLNLPTEFGLQLPAYHSHWNIRNPCRQTESA